MNVISSLSANGALDLWSIRFKEQERERAFKRYYAKRNGPTDQFILLSGLGIYAAYGILDWLTLGPLAFQTITIRTVGCLLLMPLIGWTFTKRGTDHLMWVAATEVLVVAISIGIMLRMMGTITPPYYVGFIHLALIFASGIQMNARICGTLLILTYAIFLITAPSISERSDLIAAHFFLLATFGSCAVMNIVLERNRRIEFIEFKEKQIYYAKVQELATEAEDSLQRRNALLNVLGHVVKTPLHQVIGYAQVIEQTAKIEQNTGEVVGFAEEIIRAGQTLSRQSQRILDYTRADAGLLSCNLQRSTPARLINEALHRHRETAQEKHIALEIECTDTNVLVDTRHLVNGLHELVDNAIRYCPPGSTVRIWTEVSEHSTTLSICDDGPGIPESEITRTHDALNQTLEFSNMGGDKLGIGVSLAKILIRISGGALYFCSFPEQGCLAQIVLQRAAANTSRSPRNAAAHN